MEFPYVSTLEFRPHVFLSLILSRMAQEYLNAVHGNVELKL